MSNKENKIELPLKTCFLLSDGFKLNPDFIFKFKTLLKQKFLKTIFRILFEHAFPSKNKK